MPKVLTKRKRPPPGFDLVEGRLDEFEDEMREAQVAGTDVTDADSARPENEQAWAVIRITHARTRYVFDMFHRDKAISRRLFEWLQREKYADKALCDKWRKQGYRRLCCMMCINPQHSAGGGVCVCRLPTDVLDKRGGCECQHCGCKGCGESR